MWWGVYVCWAGQLLSKHELVALGLPSVWLPPGIAGPVYSDVFLCMAAAMLSPSSLMPVRTGFQRTDFQRTGFQRTDFQRTDFQRTGFQITDFQRTDFQRVEMSVQLAAFRRQVAHPYFAYGLGIDEWKSMCNLQPLGGKLHLPICSDGMGIDDRASILLK